MGEQLLAISEPFPAKYVHTNPSGGGSYVKHHVVTQRLLYVLGPHSFEMVQIVRGDVAALPPNPQGNSEKARAGSLPLVGAVVGVIARLRVRVDNRDVTVEEAGDCEQPHQWNTDGARLKDAMSDAYKRCAMRLGCGLHLWSGEEYFLQELLTKDSGGGARTQTTETSAQDNPPEHSAEDATATVGSPSEASSADVTVDSPSTEAEEGALGTPAPSEADEENFQFTAGPLAGRWASEVALNNPEALQARLDQQKIQGHKREIAEALLAKALT